MSFRELWCEEELCTRVWDVLIAAINAGGAVLNRASSDWLGWLRILWCTRWVCLFFWFRSWWWFECWGGRGVRVNRNVNRKLFPVFVNFNYAGLRGLDLTLKKLWGILIFRFIKLYYILYIEEFLFSNVRVKRKSLHDGCRKVLYCVLAVNIIMSLTLYLKLYIWQIRIDGISSSVVGIDN